MRIEEALTLFSGHRLDFLLLYWFSHIILLLLLSLDPRKILCEDLLLIIEKDYKIFIMALVARARSRGSVCVFFLNRKIYPFET